jgi:hypothetical protein
MEGETRADVGNVGVEGPNNTDQLDELVREKAELLALRRVNSSKGEVCFNLPGCEISFVY